MIVSVALLKLKTAKYACFFAAGTDVNVHVLEGSCFSVRFNARTFMNSPPSY